MFLIDNLWKIFEICEEENRDGDNMPSDVASMDNMFITCINGGGEHFKCMEGVDKEMLKAQWAAEDQAAAQTEYNMIVHGQGGNNDFCRYKELCDAYHAGDRKKFQAIVDEALAAYHGHG